MGKGMVNDLDRAQPVCSQQAEAPVTKSTIRSPTSPSVEYCPGVLTISTDTQDALYIGFGIATNYASGEAPCMADVRLGVEYQGTSGAGQATLGAVLGTRRT